MPSELKDKIARRAAAAGLFPTDDVLAGCAGYLELLAKWNRKINLTSLPIDPPSDAAIDRLIIEPLIGAQQLERTDRHLIDLGSGGGSPALPLKIAAPWMQLTMVESRERKAAFLREAARVLSLENVTVEARRLEDVQRTTPVDAVSLRAIKVDDQLKSALSRLRAESVKVLWFRGKEERADFPGLAVRARLSLPGQGSELIVLT